MDERQPNKPDGETPEKTPSKPEDRGAVENQSETTPDAYPDDADGKPDYGGN